MKFFFNEIIRVTGKSYIFKINVSSKYHKCELCSFFKYCLKKTRKEKYYRVFNIISCIDSAYLKEI